MKLRGLSDEDFLQYQKPAMFVIFPYCSFKCDKENGSQVCQNWALSQATLVEITAQQLVQRYLENSITEAVVCGGLEPLDSFEDVLSLIKELRRYCNHPVVIYTGYREEEVVEKIEALQKFDNIIVKFGRFKPNQKPHFDSVLGVSLASNNQYAKKIS